MGKCSEELKTRKDIENFLQRFPAGILTFKMDGCDHCEHVVAAEEQSCKTEHLGTGTAVGIATCEIKNNKDCHDLWQQIKPPNLPKDENGREKYGAPVTLFVKEGKPIKRILGGGAAQIEEIKVAMNDLGKFNKMVMQQAQSGSPQGRALPPEDDDEDDDNAPPQRPMAQNAPPRPGLYNHGIHNAMAGVIAENVPAKVMAVRANPRGYRQVAEPLCTPMVDCDYKTFNQKLIDFVFD